MISMNITYIHVKKRQKVVKYIVKIAFNLNEY